MTPPPSDAKAENDTILSFRAQFPNADANSLVHLNNAGQAPMCKPALEVLEIWAKRFHLEGAHAYPPLVKEMTKARGTIAEFLGCQAHELSFFQSAAGAISQVAFGFPFKAGDEIIVWEQEYPSNLYPWNEAAKRAGAKLVVLPNAPDLSTPIDAIANAITPRTRLIASSWIQFRTGAILDLVALATLARARRIFTCIDIIQGAGCFPFNFAAIGIDAACGGSHKWMAASHGAGFLAMREEHFDKITPIMFGAATIQAADYAPDLNARPRPDSLRFEPGSKAFLEILALAEAAQLLKSTGLSRIAQEAEWLARNLMHGLRERGYLINSPHGDAGLGSTHFRGAIVSFRPGPDARHKSLGEIEKRFQENRISYGMRPPGLRLSPHGFNSLSDIERVLNLLE